jgi:hypothetical protein
MGHYGPEIHAGASPKSFTGLHHPSLSCLLVESFNDGQIATVDAEMKDKYLRTTAVYCAFVDVDQYLKMAIGVS